MAPLGVAGASSGDATKVPFRRARLCALPAPDWSSLLGMAQKSTPPPGGPAEFRARADALVSQLTLEEKAALCSGKDFWSTKAIERLGIPSIFMTDGPHGVRKAEGTDFTNSVPATCFPTASALASSWDVELLRALGEALGKE